MDFKTINYNISNNLKILRKKKKLTQEQVVNLIGEENISLRSYKTYEAGNSLTVPLLDKLIILAEFYNVSLDSLIFNKPLTYDDSFTKKDCFKRLGRLIYSLVLVPEKDNDPSSKHYGKYFFYNLDNDVTLFLDKISLICSQKDIAFEYKNKNLYKGIDDFDEAFKDIDDLHEDWSPTLKRFNFLLEEENINSAEFLKERINRIIKKRKNEQIKNE